MCAHNSWLSQYTAFSMVTNLDSSKSSIAEKDDLQYIQGMEAFMQFNTCTPFDGVP